MADEAHRSQYGNKARVDNKSGQLKYGYAHHMRTALPNAGYIGFTGTPIEQTDKDTKLVFGDYIDIYDIQQAEKMKQQSRYIMRVGSFPLIWMVISIQRH